MAGIITTVCGSLVSGLLLLAVVSPVGAAGGQGTRFTPWDDISGFRAIPTENADWLAAAGNTLGTDLDVASESAGKQVENLEPEPVAGMDSPDDAAEGPVDAASQYYLGVKYAGGQGVPRDDVLGAKWFQLAAEQDHVQAQYRLGMCYLLGEGLSQDYPEALKWFRKAAEQGDANAQYWLGRMYYHQQGVERGFETYIGYNFEAKRFFQLAADQGHVQAQCALGDMYRFPSWLTGLQHDKAEMEKWYRKAADQGYICRGFF
jgi:TPR repeat protein